MVLAGHTQSLQVYLPAVPSAQVLERAHSSKQMSRRRRVAREEKQAKMET